MNSKIEKLKKTSQFFLENVNVNKSMFILANTRAEISKLDKK